MHLIVKCLYLEIMSVFKHEKNPNLQDYRVLQLPGEIHIYYAGDKKIPAARTIQEYINHRKSI